MKLTPTFVSSLILMFGSLSPSAAQFISGPNIKTVFSEVVVNGLVTTQAARTTRSTDSAGNITVKHLTEIIVPDGAGGFTKYERQETTTAILTAGGSYTVIVNSALIATPWTAASGDANGAPAGVDVTTIAPQNLRTGVSVLNLNLQTSTEYVPIDPELNIPIDTFSK